MADYLVANVSGGTLSNVNAGGIDLPDGSLRTVTLDDTELGVLASTAGVAIMKSTATYQQKRNAAKVLKYRESEAGAAL